MDSQVMTQRASRVSVSALPFLLRVRCAPRMVVQRADVVQAGRAIASSGGSTLPLLVEVSALREVTWDARQAVLSYRHPARVVILGSDAVDLVLTAFTVRSPTTIRFFTDRDSAVRWLLQR